MDELLRFNFRPEDVVILGQGMCAQWFARLHAQKRWSVRVIDTCEYAYSGSSTDPLIQAVRKSGASKAFLAGHLRAERSVAETEPERMGDGSVPDFLSHGSSYLPKLRAFARRCNDVGAEPVNLSKRVVDGSTGVGCLAGREMAPRRGIGLIRRMRRALEDQVLERWTLISPNGDEIEHQNLYMPGLRSRLEAQTVEAGSALLLVSCDTWGPFRTHFIRPRFVEACADFGIVAVGVAGDKFLFENWQSTLALCAARGVSLYRLPFEARMSKSEPPD